MLRGAQLPARCTPNAHLLADLLAALLLAVLLLTLLLFGVALRWARSTRHAVKDSSTGQRHSMDLLGNLVGTH